MKASMETEKMKETREILEQAVKEELRPKRSLKKPLTMGLGAVLALGAGLGAGQYWMHAISVEETDDAYITGHIHKLSSRVSGTVTRLLVDDNDHVKSGQLLIQIDPTDYKIKEETARAIASQATFKIDEIETDIQAASKVAQARALEAVSSEASAEAGVELAREQLAEARLGVKVASAQVKQREAELTRCKADFERYSALVEDRAATKQSLERAKQDAEVAEANLLAARESHGQAVSRVKQAEKTLADAKSGVIRSKSDLANAAAAKIQLEKSKRNLKVQSAAAEEARRKFEDASTQLSYTKVAAPVTGKVGHRTVEVGQQIERGQALMSIVSDEKWVVANFKETQLGKIRPGQEVDIKVDAFPGAHFKGKIDSISPASGAKFALLPPDNATGNFTKVVQRIPVKIIFDKASLKDYENLLAPGMSVIPEVHLDTKL